ncbi:MAG: hypothetical protein U0269_03625 [Polyangiales bacterium]
MRSKHRCWLGGQFNHSRRGPESLETTASTITSLFARVGPQLATGTAQSAIKPQKERRRMLAGLVIEAH